jgi:hypothetical protein
MTSALAAGDVTHTIAAAEEVYRLQGCSLWKVVVGPRASPHYQLTYLRLSLKDWAQTLLDSYQLVSEQGFR